MFFLLLLPTTTTATTRKGALEPQLIAPVQPPGHSELIKKHCLKPLPSLQSCPFVRAEKRIVAKFRIWKANDLRRAYYCSAGDQHPSFQRQLLWRTNNVCFPLGPIRIIFRSQMARRPLQGRHGFLSYLVPVEASNAARRSAGRGLELKIA